MFHVSRVSQKTKREGRFPTKKKNYVIEIDEKFALIEDLEYYVTRRENKENPIFCPEL